MNKNEKKDAWKRTGKHAHWKKHPMALPKKQQNRVEQLEDILEFA